jgi:GR25 family glycosyltransferase involved in LPS biosynthesis
MGRTKKKTISRKKKTLKKQKGGNKTKAYVINLKRRTDRKEKMIQKFKNSSFDLEFIEGIETPGDSHRGIGASFKKIVQMAKDSNLPAVLIFEDDTKPEENMDKNWNICKQWLDSNRDKYEVFFGSARTDGNNQTINIIETLDNNIKLVNFSYNLTLNWTYLNSSAYDKLLEWTIEKYGPIDRYLGNINYFNNLVCYPFLGLQESDVSNSWGSYQNLTSNVKLIKDVFQKAINEKSGGAYNLKNITISILSWKSCKTLKNTLESYKKNGLFDLIETFIYFQEISDVEKKLADKYNISYIGTPQNIGIQKALIEMINNTKTNYFIFAENDFELIHNKDETQKVFEDCIKLLENDDVQIVKLRDIQNPGEPNYSKYTYQNDYKDKPNVQDFPYKLEALSYVENPETVFPNSYKIINYNYKWYKSSSKENKWSNNIFIAKTQWMKDKIIPLIDLAQNNTKNIYIFENNLIENLKDYNLAAGMGLFKHNRLERGECTIDDIQNGGSYKYGGNRNNRGLDDTRRRKERKQKGGSSKIHYITVSTEKNDKLQRLLDSAKRFNIHIEVLGLEMNTSNLGHNNKAKFGMKLGLPLEYISKLDPNDIVLFTDAWDVVYINNEEEIIKRYLEFNKPIVFGAELFSWPDENRSVEYTDTQDKYFKYLNSGLYIGKAGDLKRFLENYKGGEDIDDQRFWVDLYLKHRDKIALDTENRLFLNTSGTDKKDFDFENDVFTFKKTTSHPLILHANGNDKSYLDLVFHKTYVINLADRTDRKDDMIKKFKHTVFDLEFIEGIKHDNGYLGCSLSIQKVVQKAKDMNLKTVLFFEDDNKPLDDYEGRWTITKEWLDNNLDKWDIFNGGARVREQYLDSVKLIQSLNKNVNLFQADLILNTNWIYVNSRAYDKILAWKLEDNPSIMCIDNFMGDKNHFNVLFIYPFLGFQESGKTNTEKNVIRDYSKNEKTRVDNMDTVMKRLKQSGGSNKLVIYDTTNSWEKDYIVNDILENASNIEYLKPEEIKSTSFDSCDVFVFSTNTFNYEEADNVITQLKPSLVIMCSDEQGNHSNYLDLSKKTKLYLHQYNHKSYTYPENTLQIPLGYSDVKLNTNLKKPNERKYVWSFIGNQKQDRKDMVDIFKKANLGESYINNSISKQEMYDIYSESVFVPNGRGHHTLDCFRLYEATVAGAIPVLVGSQEEIDVTFHYNNNKPPFIYASSWEEAVNSCKNMLADKNALEEKQNNILEWWKTINELIKNRIHLQSGGEIPTAYIKKANTMENEYLYPILKNVFPNKKIELVSDRESYDLVLKSHWDDGTNGNDKYIFISPERYDATQTYAFNDPNCIAKIFTSTHPDLLSQKDSFYLPYFLDNGPFIFNESPMKREFTNNTRDRLAAYVAGYSPEHRDKMFKALYDLDDTKTTDGLGKANHTTDKDIPPREKWWELPNVYKDYIFGFAMENTNEDGYITEKIMNVYRGGAIPIYWGTSKVKHIFNPESFIYVNDYPSFEDCAKDIIAISKNKERLEKMQNAPIFNTNSVIDYSKYFDTSSPQWVIDIANSIKTKISTQSGSSIQKILINYTNRNEIENRKRIKDSAMSIGGFTSVIEYNPNDIDEEFREKNKQILETVRGGGLWLWKPYFILKTLNTMNENDILVYLDCDMYFISPIDKYIDFMKDKSMMITQIEDVHLEKKYTKMDIFVELKCENNKEITDTAQLTTSPSIWKKTQNTIDFVKLWLEYCQNYHLLSDEPSNAPNFSEFIDNRHDQSLLSSLAKLNKDKYNILIERCAIHYCNDTRNPSLPELVAAQ